MASEEREPSAAASKWARLDLPTSAGAVESGRAPPPNSEIGRIIKGKYRIVAHLGTGGMAVVYLAEELGLIRREVAIKLLRPESGVSQATLARFFKEAQSIAAINHPNVVQLIDIDRAEDGQVYLVMERLIGKTLHQVLADMRQAGDFFTWDRLTPLMLQACRALQAAHKQNIVHRDIKPSNCFLVSLGDEEWHLKLLDFGIAKVRTGHESSADSLETPLTQDGMFVGTPHYAAPEVIRQLPDHQIDGRADVFGLGVLMYQCLTGTLPFQGDHQDKLTILYRTINERPQPPRERAPDRNISPEVDALIMRAMEIDPTRRFASITELADAIRSATRTNFDGSGPRKLLISDPVLDRTPRPPGERLPPTPESMPRVADLGLPPQGPSGPLTPSPTTPPTTAVGADQATPKPPGESVSALTSPTAIQQVPVRTSPVTLVAVGVMSLGLLALLVLLVYDLGRVQAPATSPARSPMRKAPAEPVSPRPANRPTASAQLPAVPAPARPAPPAPAPDDPAPARPAPPASAPDDPAPAPPPKIADEPPPEPATTGDALAPNLSSSSKSDPRMSEVKAKLKALVDSHTLDKCLPIYLAIGDGIYDELPLKLQLDAKGQAKASAASRKVKQRLPQSADACIFKLIEAQQFPSGDGNLVLTHTLRFD